MLSKRWARSLFTWLAVVAMLMVAWAPAVSQLMGSEAARALAEVCSATRTGLSPVSYPADDNAPTVPVSHLMAHCPYCALHLDTLGPVPAGMSVHLPQTLSDAPPPAFLAAPRTLFAWVVAQPRAPPLPA